MRPSDRRTRLGERRYYAMVKIHSQVRYLMSSVPLYGWSGSRCECTFH